MNYRLYFCAQLSITAFAVCCCWNRKKKVGSVRKERERFLGDRSRSNHFLSRPNNNINQSELLVSHSMLRRTIRRVMKYADLELTTRGEFPHGLKDPLFVKKPDKNLPWYFSTFNSVYLWPVLGDNWSDLKEEDKRHDLHMFYTLAWWKLGEGIFDDS